jgi:hypothetical protein
MAPSFRATERRLDHMGGSKVLCKKKADTACLVTSGTLQLDTEFGEWIRADQRPCLQEWRHQLRSSLHPILFAAVYRAAALLSRLFNVLPASQAAILLAAPKVVQALFAAGLDFFTWRLGQRIFGPTSRAAWTIVCCPELPPRRALTLVLPNRVACI